MIVDTIENKAFTATLNGNLAKALEIASTTDFTQMEEGRYDVDGDNLYYLVQRYTTKDPENGKLEGHEKYIDVQFIVSGCEALGYAPIESIMKDTEYNGQKDIIFYQNTPLMTNVLLTQGMYAILYPNDAHAPGMTAIEQQDVCKVVFKVKA